MNSQPRTPSASPEQAPPEVTEAHLRLLIEQVPAIQWMTDRELRFTLYVGSALPGLGLQPGQLVGTQLTDRVAADHPAIQAHRRALSGESSSYESVHQGRQFESYVEPLRDPHGTVIGVVGVGFDRTRRRAADDSLQALTEIGRKLAAELDLEKLVQATTDSATQLIGAQFGAFFYNVINGKGESHQLYSFSGAAREAFNKFPMPRNTAVFAPTFKGEGIVRSDDIRRDPRYGKSAPHFGMPAGHLPVVSYLAVPVISRTGEVLGGLRFGHVEPGRFTEHHERLVSGVVSYATVAMENAQLYRRSQESAKEVQALMESVPAAIWITGGPDAGKITGNQFSYEVVGATPGQNVSLSSSGNQDPTHEVYLDGRRADPAELPIQQAVATGHPVLGRELEIHRRDGTVRHLYGNAVPILDEDGKVKQVVAAFTDITRRKNAEATLRELAKDREREISDLTRLHEFSTRLSRAIDEKGVLQELLQATVGLQGATMGFVELVDPEKKALIVTAAIGHRPEAGEKLGFVPIEEGRGASGTAAARRERVIVEDVERDPLFAPYLEFARWAGVRSVWSVPLFGAGGKLVGVLSTHRAEPHRPGAREIRLVELYANQAAYALESARRFHDTEKALIERLEGEEAAARLAAIVESSDDAIISKTLDGVITSWNRAAERLFGYTPSEAIGKPITLIIPRDRLDEEREIIGKIFRGERVIHFETVRQRKDGGLVDLSLTVSPVRDASGRITGASKIARDVSDLKRGRERMDQLYALAQAEIDERKKAEARTKQLNDLLEIRVRQRTASLEEKVQELNTFAYTVAHDLRAPLRSLHQFSDLLLEDHASTLGPQARDYLDRIIRGAERMDTLILDLLAYSKVARADINLVPVDAAEVVSQVLAQLAPEAKRLNARMDIKGQLPVVFADPVLLSQCLTNLITNALKFTAEGKPPHVTVRGQRRGDAVRIEVEDRGIGIALEHHDRIFHLFERLNPPATYPGTGVGLAIVKKAAERMSGLAGLESEAGKGSVFWIELRSATP